VLPLLLAVCLASAGLAANTFLIIRRGMDTTDRAAMTATLKNLGRPLPAVVLGMGSDPILDRADLAAALWRDGHVSLFVTAGGQGPDETEPESLTLATALIAQGVPAALIHQDDRSRNTVENIRNATAILAALPADQQVVPGQKLLIVTHHYHGARAGEIAAGAGFDPVVVTTRGPRLDRLPMRLAREVLSYLRWSLLQKPW
jgi:uncharacterized SAM-binding protein YcdF (DUF218 family)